MASRKVTVTLPEEQVSRIRALVASGHFPSASAFVRRAVEVAIDDTDRWNDVLDAWLADTRGPLTAEEQTWAEDIVGRWESRRASFVVTPRR